MTCYWSRGRTITKTREVADSCTTLHEGAPALAQIEGPDAHYHEFAEFAFAHENVIHMLIHMHIHWASVDSCELTRIVIREPLRRPF